MAAAYTIAAENCVLSSFVFRLRLGVFVAASSCRWSLSVHAGAALAAIVCTTPRHVICLFVKSVACLHSARARKTGETLASGAGRRRATERNSTVRFYERRARVLAIVSRGTSSARTFPLKRRRLFRPAVQGCRRRFRCVTQIFIQFFSLRLMSVFGWEVKMLPRST